MTFTLTDSAGGSSLVLVHGPAGPSDTYAQGPLDMGQSYASRQQVDVWPKTRADYVTVLPRKNHSASRAFSAERVFGTAEAAHSFAAQHTAAVLTLTRLVFVSGALTLNLHGAMESCVCTVTGVSVRIDYVWTYGRVEVL